VRTLLSSHPRDLRPRLPPPAFNPALWTRLILLYDGGISIRSYGAAILLFRVSLAETVLALPWTKSFYFFEVCALSQVHLCDSALPLFFPMLRFLSPPSFFSDHALMNCYAGTSCRFFPRPRRRCTFSSPFPARAIPVLGDFPCLDGGRVRSSLTFPFVFFFSKNFSDHFSPRCRLFLPLKDGTIGAVLASDSCFDHFISRATEQLDLDVPYHASDDAFLLVTEPALSSLPPVGAGFSGRFSPGQG